MYCRCTCGVVALLGGLVLAGQATAQALPAGNPFGTTYSVSGRNYGKVDVSGNGVGTFGADLLFVNEQSPEDNDLTGDAQLGPIGTAPITLTFDGNEEIVGNLAFNERYEVFPGTGLSVYHPLLTPPEGLALPYGWNTPAHMIEFSVRGTSAMEDSGGLLNDGAAPAILRTDGVNVNSTAVPVFPGDRAPNDPALAPYSLDNTYVGYYFYFKKDGMPANPIFDINFYGGAILSADHPTIPGQTIYVPIGQVDDQFDIEFTHDIASGTFSFNFDSERDLSGSNFLQLADGSIAGGSVGGLGFLDAASQIDEIVTGFIYRLIASADGNEDAKVDGLDYLLWAGQFGETDVTNPASPDTIWPAPGRTYNQYLGDFNSDGNVDGLDYLQWASQFGFIGDGSDQLAAAVPEPASSALAMLAAAGGYLASQRRRRR
ncbi:MAG: hypothetical protein KDA63_18400 [Planctomycetales bacterium]|nr:hypothetical protein [Planctomycetales bacterium]